MEGHHGISDVLPPLLIHDRTDLPVDYLTLGLPVKLVERVDDARHAERCLVHVTIAVELGPGQRVDDGGRTDTAEQRAELGAQLKGQLNSVLVHDGRRLAPVQGQGSRLLG